MTDKIKVVKQRFLKELDLNFPTLDKGLIDQKFENFMNDILFEQNVEKEESRIQNEPSICNHQNIINEVIKLREKLSLQNA